MSLSYLDKTGLTALWGKVKALNKEVHINMHHNTRHPRAIYSDHIPGVVYDSVTDKYGTALTIAQAKSLIEAGVKTYLNLTGYANSQFFTPITLILPLNSLDVSNLQDADEEATFAIFYVHNHYIPEYSPYYTIKLTDNSIEMITSDNFWTIKDEYFKATYISYDNTSSGLTATNVQDAIDEVVTSSGGGDPQYARGDSVNLEDGIFAGSWYQPKTLFFFIPLPKGMTNTGSVSISGKWLVRAGTGGRIIDNVALNTVGTVSVNKKATGIMVRVVLSTASTTYKTDQACTAYGSSSAKITFNT